MFEDQLACADLVVLSKSDLVSAEQLAEIETKLKALEDNPFSFVYTFKRN